MKPQSLQYGDTIGFIAPCYVMTPERMSEGIVPTLESLGFSVKLEFLLERMGSLWRTICGGNCEGILTGGYLVNYAVMLGGVYFRIDRTKPHIHSTEENRQVDEIFRRFGEKYGIPVVRCEDFGHGANNAIFPLGVGATLDADNLTLEFTESGVIL